MNRDSNKHTYIFSALMVVSVAFVLSFTSESLKDLQNANVKKEKMQNILSTVGINVTRDESELLYKDYISEEAEAKKNKLGLWQGQFILPWKWRRKNR